MPSLFGLPVAHTSVWIFNCYVIAAGDDVVVVDPGLAVVADRARTLIAGPMGRSKADIAAVACTHGHADHVGGVSTLVGDTNTDIHLPQRCRSYLAGERARAFPFVESSLRFMPVYREQPFSARALRQFVRAGVTLGHGGPRTMKVDFEPTGFLTDGSRLPGADGWEVIHTPGHTDDSTCFYHSDSATLISGDAVVSQDGHAWFNPEYVDRAASGDTEERLRSLEVRHLLPGHGPPLRGPDVWATARSATREPTGDGLLVRCSRRFGRWG